MNCALSALEESLPQPPFLRVQKSFVVHLGGPTGVRRGAYHVQRQVYRSRAAGSGRCRRRWPFTGGRAAEEDNTGISVAICDDFEEERRQMARLLKNYGRRKGVAWGDRAVGKRRGHSSTCSG